MAKLVLIALAAAAAAAPLGAQTVPDPDGYGPPPPPRVRAPDAPPPGVSWREPAPGARRYVVQPPATEMAPGVRTRTWVEQEAEAGPPLPPPPPMAGGMHRYDGPPPPMDGRRWGDRDGMRRHVEIRRYGRGPAFVPPPMGWQGGYAMERAPLPPPPPCPGPCGPRPLPYGYGYGGGSVIVTETTVTEAPVVEKRVYYTTVRERVRVVRRHHRPCRCKLVKARPRAGERG
ncbi:MAG: hypothetical protein JO013_09095 [Alphaproteobacteria bacterium]|nr:hypothetical protein [Alphaproteobacteria bacterium]